MVLFKTWPFFQLFFKEIQARKTSFTIFQNEKTPFQPIKTRSSKSRKIDVFPKGLTYGFGSKNGLFFHLFFLSNIGQENVCYDTQEQKTTFQTINTKSLKSRKVKIFQRLNPWLCSKNGYFSTFFQPIQARKMCFQIFKNEKPHFQATKNDVQKV